MTTLDHYRGIALSITAPHALRCVLAERQKQEDKWGEQNHDPFTYLTILMEEVGELSQAALHLRFGGDAASKIFTEAVQTAAVALAIVESLDRGIWRWPVPRRVRGEEREVIAVPKNCIPAGGKLTECYETADEFIVLGTPSPTEDEDDPAYHNCDEMGCSSCSHVVARIQKLRKAVEK